MPARTTADATPGQGGGERDPAQLLALDAAGVAEAHHQRPGTDRKTTNGEDERRGDGDPHGTGQGGDGDRVHGRLVWRDDQSGPDRQRHQEAGRRGRGHPGPPAPAGRGQRPGRREQQDEADAGQPDE
jgi:hypothetical protein